MYYYYWATAAGYKIWWKRYVTVLQISQFVIDLGMVYFGSKSARRLCSMEECTDVVVGFVSILPLCAQVRLSGCRRLCGFGICCSTRVRYSLVVSPALHLVLPQDVQEDVSIPRYQSCTCEWKRCEGTVCDEWQCRTKAGEWGNGRDYDQIGSSFRCAL